MTWGCVGHKDRGCGAGGMGGQRGWGHTWTGVWRCGGHMGDEGHMGTQGQRGHRERDGGRVGMRGSGGGGKGQQSGCSPPPRQDVAFFDAHRTGQLVARLTADVQEFKSSFKLIISQVGPSTRPPPPPHDPPAPPLPVTVSPPPAGPAQQHPGCRLCAVPVPAVPTAHGAAAAGAARVGGRWHRAGLRAAGAVPAGTGTGNGFGGMGDM